MDYFEAKRRRGVVKVAEARGEVADSMEVRIVLIERMNKGELTLEQVQSELARIKRQAKANGKTTRADIWKDA